MAERACCNVGALITRKQRGDQELIGEHRELPHEVDELGVGRAAVAEPARVSVVGDDRVVQQVAVDPFEKITKAIDLLFGQLAPAKPVFDP